MLVVDDEDQIRETIEWVLRDEGCVVWTARNGADALSLLRDRCPDVILLDIGLPEIDGYEVARRLRELPELRRARLIALTGYGQLEDLRRARDARFDDHLVKPVDFATLGRCVAGSNAGGLGRLNG